MAKYLVYKASGWVCPVEEFVLVEVSDETAANELFEMGEAGDSDAANRIIAEFPTAELTTLLD